MDEANGIPYSFSSTNDNASLINSGTLIDTHNGIRTWAGDSATDTTPIWATLDAVGTAMPAAVSTDQARVIVLITDGDESNDCGHTPAEAAAKAATLYNNAGTTIGSHVQTYVIAYTGTASISGANNIAHAGTGGGSYTGAGVFQPGVADASGNFECPTGSFTCHDAFRAQDVDELLDTLQAVMTQALIQGKYSEQQSITESVYELTRQVTACASGVECFDPRTRTPATASRCPCCCSRRSTCRSSAATCAPSTA